MSDLEAVVVDADNGTPFGGGAAGDDIVEATTAGGLVSHIDSSYLLLLGEAGQLYAPRNTDLAQTGFYTADRKLDNDANDGAIYPVAAGSSGGGTAPGHVRIASGGDDAEASAGGKPSLSSSDLELVTDTSAQTVGLRLPPPRHPRRGEKSTTSRRPCGCRFW